jgi:restriction system protein
MKNYYRIMLGSKSSLAQECRIGNFIGVNYDIKTDLSNNLHDDWRVFNKEYIPYWISQHPEKSKIAAGLACGMTWTVSKGINIGDIVICPNGEGAYFVGEILDNYSYHPNTNLPHRRHVKWFEKNIERADMSQELQYSTGSTGSVSKITKYSIELEKLLSGIKPNTIISTDETIEDPSVFALEKHLEEFLVQNWSNTELGKMYDIFQEEGEKVGQQYQTDTGAIDILAISKDKKEILVVELKKGRASDNVVGQIQRYMGYVKEELLEENQIVKGIIIALEDDLRIRRALSVTNNIEFYRYQVSFKLYKN